MPAHGERHVASGALDLGGELDAGRGRAHHQHRAVREAARDCDSGRHDLDDVGRERGREPAGRWARSQCPVAITTLAARHTPAVVSTRNPPRSRSTAVTVTPVWTGAENERE